jgi:hypothetical protein
MVAAIAAAALILGSRLALDEWPGLGRSEGKSTLRVAPRYPSSSVVLSATGAPTPAAALARAALSQAAPGVRAGDAAQPAADAVATGVTGAHVPQLRRPAAPSTPSDATRAPGGLEAAGDEGAALVARGGAAAGAAVGPASPALGRAVARSADAAGGAVGREVRGALAIIRRLRERP